MLYIPANLKEIFNTSTIRNGCRHIIMKTKRKMQRFISTLIKFSRELKRFFLVFDISASAYSYDILKFSRFFSLDILIEFILIKKKRVAGRLFNVKLQKGEMKLILSVFYGPQWAKMRKRKTKLLKDILCVIYYKIKYLDIHNANK